MKSQKRKKKTIWNIIRKILGILIVIIGSIISIPISINVLNISAAATKNGFFGYLAMTVCVILCVGCFAYLGMMLFKTKKSKILISSIISTSVYAILMTFLLVILYAPVKNNSQYTNLTNNYWQLETGSKIAYAEFKDEVTKEYPIVFVHGGAGSPVNGKEELVDSLVADGYKVYQYDQFGAGNSSRAKDPKEYTVNRQVEDLECIRKTIGSDKMILIGHSWGGELVGTYLAAYPEHVQNSIFISPGSLWAGDKSISQLSEEGKRDQSQVLNKNFRFLALNILSGMGDQNGLYYLTNEEKLDKIFMNFHDDLNMKPGSGEYYNSVGAGYGFWVNNMTGKDSRTMDSIYDSLKNSTSTNLVIKGEFDYLSKNLTIKYVEEIPNTSIVEINDMGHSLEMKYVDEVYSYIKTVLES